MYRKILFFLFLFLLPFVAFNQTVKLTQLEKALTGTGGAPVKGMIGLTRASDGKQRYATYVNVADVCRPTTPLPTGNTTNLSEFVVKCSTDSVWYIDWEGRSLFLGTQAAGGGTGSADYDWLEIGNGQIPNSIRDSIWTDNYAAVNMRMVWPRAQLLVGDSTSIYGGNIVVAGNRESRVGFYRITGPNWSSIGQEGTSLTARLGTNTTAFTVQKAAGSGPTESTAYTDIFRVRTDSTIHLLDYKSTRNDTASIVNILYTDTGGILRSSPVSELPSGSGGGLDSVITSVRLTGYGTATNPLDVVNRVPSTGVTVDFVTPKYYGNESMPVSGSPILYNLANSSPVTQYVFHQAATPPTFPIGTSVISGIYQTNRVNLITITPVSNTKIIVKINE